MTKSYVEFIYPGIIVSETSSKEAKHRDPDKIELPKGSYGFRFFNQEEVRKNGEVLKGKPKQYSKWFMSGRIMTLADVKLEMPNERILISNMEINKIASVLATVSGGHIPYDEKDIEIRPIKGAKV